MSVKNYLEENGNKMEDKKIKKGKIKLNKKIVAGIVAVVLVAGTAVGIAGCGRRVSNKPTDSEIRQQQEDNVVDVEKYATPYFDSLYDNNAYLKEHVTEDPLASFFEDLTESYGIIFTEKGEQLIREEYAKYIYYESTARKIDKLLIDCIENETTTPDALALVDSNFVNSYIELLKNQNGDDYTVDRGKLVEVLEKFVKGEYTKENDLDKLKSVVGTNIVLSELEKNDFGINHRFESFNRFYTGILAQLTNTSYHRIISTIENGKVSVLKGPPDFIALKYGKTPLTNEQMKVEFKNIITKEEAIKLFEKEMTDAEYENILSVMFTDYVREQYTFAYGIDTYEFDLKNIFDISGTTATLKSNPKFKITLEKLYAPIMELEFRVNEEIIKSKIKYGEYTIDGAKEIEKPKILVK